ncbi:HAD family hydrolase [Paenibacillus nasutitermitis]|uniref:Hydrolase of the HAD superfamily n=1 Tax=Paenibacillus nasutitermitis TaxID=1652958 RepID=A0A916Z8U4_9BACL|nr:HAD family hydrolase [Paenibacillus nasutitermitis]GGD80649.1 hypothetical protein GCM10010911_43500 [Paenibacillus nasutitermitis]
MNIKDQAVIFDLDNTLLDRKKSLQTFSEKLHKRYIQPEYSEQQVFNRLSKADGDGYRSKQDLYNDLIKSLPWKTPLSFLEFRSFWDSEFPNSSELMEGAVHLLDYLKGEGYKLALITNGNQKIQYSKISSAKIGDFFDIIHISEEIGLKKPDKAIFELTLKVLKIDPCNAYYVGDHPRNDVYGAINAGLHAIWLEGYVVWDETLAVGQFKTIRKLDEIIEILKEA